MKIIAIDMDGTLLNSKNSVDQNQLDYLENLAKQENNHIVISTGRPIEGVLNMLPLSLREKLYILALNGSIVVDPNNHILFQSSLEAEDIEKLYNYSMKVNGTVCVLDSYNYYHLSEEVTDLMKYDVSLNKMELLPINFDEVYGKIDVTKFLLFIDPDRIGYIRENLPEELHLKYSIVFSQPYLIEFLPKNVDKASSLLKLTDYLSVSKENIIVIGDGLNDISMLKIASVAIAMGNAVPEVKKIADYITLTNDENGVKHALENCKLEK